MNYINRENCIFCFEKLITSYFENDYKAHIGHYAIDNNIMKSELMFIPYNISICSKCNTVQNKYLGDLNEVYKYNHADSTGSTMINLHKLTCNILMKYKDEIHNIIEIGSARGVLADILLEKYNTKYYVIEPNFFGNIKNKIIINDFYENVNDMLIDANTIIISHVFEHFYKPREILDKIFNNKNIINFFLVFPDLEYYINNNILHVLNTEHTYYIDNDFLIDLLDMYGFKLMTKEYYKNHSVIFYFKRYRYTCNEITFTNKNYSVEKYYNNIFDKIKMYNNILENNKDNKIFIFPASIHTLFLFQFGLKEELLSGFIDNSILKIGNKMYGTNLIVHDFNEIIKQKDIILLLNGGIFNNEIINILETNNIEYY